MTIQVNGESRGIGDGHTVAALLRELDIRADRVAVEQALAWPEHSAGRLMQRELVVAPETAIPFLPQQMPDGLWDGLQARFSQGGIA